MPNEVYFLLQRSLLIR